MPIPSTRTLAARLPSDPNDPSTPFDGRGHPHPFPMGTSPNDDATTVETKRRETKRRETKNGGLRPFLATDEEHHRQRPASETPIHRGNDDRASLRGYAQKRQEPPCGGPWSRSILAATYSPRGSSPKYHRRWRT